MLVVIEAESNGVRKPMTIFIIYIQLVYIKNVWFIKANKTFKSFQIYIQLLVTKILTWFFCI